MGRSRTSIGRWRKAARLVTLTTVAALVLPAAASAGAVVSADPNGVTVLTVTDNDDSSDIVISHQDPSPVAGFEFRVVSDTGAITGDSDCRDDDDVPALDPDEVYCDAAGIGVISVSGAGGADELEIQDLTNPVPTSYLTSVNGGSGTDVLRGGDGNDTLDGGADTVGDSLLGDAGADLMRSGGDGPDLLVGSSGSDEIDYGDAPSAVGVSLDTDENDGVDCPGASCENDEDSGVENVTGSASGDVLRGNDVDNVLDGGGGSDVLFGGPGGDTEDGADTFIGGTHGTSGDSVSYQPRDDPIVAEIDGAPDSGSGGCPSGAGCEGDRVEEDVENLFGGTDDDTLIGSEPDAIDGVVGDNSIFGLGGDDALAGGRSPGPDGDDRLFGGLNDTGGDIVTYVSRQDDIRANLGAGFGGRPLGGDTDELDGLENATGGHGDDELTGEGGPNHVTGGDGDDFLVGGAQGTPDGADVFAGGPHGTDGDTVGYVSRNDAVVASLEPGADEDGDLIGADVENLYGGSGGDNLTGNSGPNELTGGEGDDTLEGLGGVDDYLGQDHDDTLLTADNLADGTIDCGSHNISDRVSFDQGLDTPGASCELQTPVAPARCAGRVATVIGSSGPDVLRGTAGVDVIAGLGGADRIAGLGGNDIACGGGGNDGINGGAGRDTLLGQAGRDRLRGGAGRDRLIGGGGRDSCMGQGGSDRARACERRRSI